MEPTRNIILGIDPGTLLTGYCVIHITGGEILMKEMDVLKLRAKDDGFVRLRQIYSRIEELIRIFKPDSFAIEAPFYGKNVQSMLKLGRAQGVAIAAAIGAGLPVCEYSPRKIKQSITGNGNAGKEQVWKMLQQLLLLQETELKYFDASDALAVAVCHHFQNRPSAALVAPSATVPKSRKAVSGWGEFIQTHPARVIR